MLKFTSVSGSVRAITDIIHLGTIIRTGITPDLIITGHTTGTAGIVIIAIIIVIRIVTGTSLTGIATLGWLEVISSQPNFFERKLCCGYPSRARQAGGLFSYFGEAAGLVTGPFLGSSIWNSFLNC
jgi:hypothetical protein